jgi:hypothetical protein
MKGVSGKNEFSLGLFFIVQESIKVSAPSDDEKRNITAEHAEAVECKQAKKKWNNGMVGNIVGFPIFQYSIIPIV